MTPSGETVSFNSSKLAGLSRRPAIGLEMTKRPRRKRLADQISAMQRTGTFRKWKQGA